MQSIIIDSFEFNKKSLKAMGLDSAYKSSGAGDITNTSNINYVPVISDLRTNFLIKSPSDVVRVDFSFNYRYAVGGTRCIVVIDISTPITTPASLTVMDAVGNSVLATDKNQGGGFFMLKSMPVNNPIILNMKILSGTNGNAVVLSSARLHMNKVELNT